MSAFDPQSEYAFFRPTAHVRPSRHTDTVFFVEQCGVRFVLKAFSRKGDDSGEGAERLATELVSISAFQALGVHALAPVGPPEESLEISLGDRALTLRQVLVFPFRTQRTLAEAIQTETDPEPIVREAGSRIRERHDAARRVAEIHSDGAPHNIFEDWMWFDFGEQHPYSDVERAKEAEVWRFCAGTTSVSGWGSGMRLVAAFCDSYGDLERISRVLAEHRRACPYLRMCAQPVNLLRLCRGDHYRFHRLRTAMAMKAFLAAKSPG